MTGYGRADFEISGTAFEIEVRSVNHRYLDARVKLPRLLNDREHRVKAALQAGLCRGKVDLTASVSADSAETARVEIDREVAAQYVEAAAELRDQHGLSGALGVDALIAMPGVTRFADAKLPDENVDAALFDGVSRALESLDAMREREGASLAEEFASRLERVLVLTSTLESRSGEVQNAVREKLRRRTEQLQLESGLLDEARLHQEIVIAADRLDITEELVRLRSHVEQFYKILDEANRETPVGRRLDFLLQEMGREANTTGSKANDAALAHEVVELKTELERLREQVQNVE
jgi:uncharacterized protein (TIGR00255 family)